MVILEILKRNAAIQAVYTSTGRQRDIFAQKSNTLWLVQEHYFIGSMALQKVQFHAAATVP